MAALDILKDLITVGDTTQLERVIEIIEGLEKTYESMIASARKNSEKYAETINEVIRSAEKLEKQIEQLDATEKAQTATIVKAAAEAEKLLTKNEQYTKQAKEEERQLAALLAIQDKLRSGKEKLAKTVDAEKGSITALTAELKQLTNEYKAMGDATDNLVKADTVKRIGELKEQIDTANQVLKDTRKAVTFAAGSYDELNARVMEAKRQLKSMAGGIGETSQEFKELEDFVKRGSDQLKEFDKRSKTVDAEKGSITALTAELKQLTNEYKSMGDATDNLVKAETVKRIGELKEQIDTANQVLKDTRKAVTFAAGSYDELNARVMEAKRQLKSMAGGIGETSQEFKELEDFVKRGSDQLKEFDKRLGDSFRNVGNYPQVIAGAIDKVVPGAGATVDKLGGILSGTTVALGGVVTAVGAMGQAFYEESVRIKKAMETVSTLTNLQGKDLEVLTAKVSATSKVFDKDFNEVLRSSNVLMQTFKVSGTEAVDTINQALLRGVDIQGDFLEQINEYSTFVAQAGGTTQDLVDILLASEQAGVFSDKGLDTIKEATLRIRELTPATQDAIRGLGLSVDEIEKGLRSGSTSVLDVIRKITARMNELPPISREVGTAIADIFAGPGEDAGQFLFKLGEITKTQGDWTEQLTGSYRAQYELLKATEEYEAALISTAGNFQAFATNFETFWTKTKTVFLGILAELSNAFTDISERIGAFEKALAVSNDIVVLQNELRKLQQQAEGGPAWWQSLTDGVLSFGNAANAAARQVERQAEIGLKISAVQKRINELLRENTDDTKKNRDQKNQATEDINKLLEAEFRLAKFRLEQAIKEQEEIVANEANFAKKRTTAAVKAEELKNQLIDLVRKHDLAQQKLTEADKKLIQEKANADKIDNEKETKERLFQIAQQERADAVTVFQAIASDERNSFAVRADALQEAAKKRSEIVDQQLINEKISFTEYSSELLKIQQDLNTSMQALAAQMFSQDQNRIGAGVSDALRDLNDELEGGLISLQEYYRRRQQIEENGERISLQNQLEYFKKQRDNLVKQGVDTSAIDKSIADAELALSEQTAQKRIEYEQRLQDTLKQLKQNAYDTALSLFDSYFEGEQMRNQERLTRLETTYQNELALAGDNEAKKAELTNAFNQQRQAIEKEQAASARKKAIFDKAAAAFEIGVNTAVGISKAVAASPLTGGLPFSAIIAAIGALQLAAVLAKPIPQFAKGTMDSPEGLAIVNDGGGPEIIESPSGEARMYNTKGPVLTWLDRHSKVYTAEDSARRLSGQDMSDRMIAGFDDDTQRLKQIKIETDNSALERVISSKFDELIYLTKRKAGQRIDASGMSSEITKGILQADFIKNEYR